MSVPALFSRAMHPLIGITTSQGRNKQGQPNSVLGEVYSRAILEFGGVPVLLPATLVAGDWRGLVDRLDGIVFSGGGDIAAARFAGEAHPSIADVDAPRDQLEFDLLREALKRGKPFLGICRGCQMVNVGFGGTLYTHLADQFAGALEHDQPSDRRTHLVHEVQLDAGSRLLEISGESRYAVNSHHHQGLRTLGDGLRVAARAPDGLVEAVEVEGHPFGVAVQWHPEWLTDSAPASRLFTRFVDAARAS
jgi:putative glutamine amidotransferase